MRTYRGGVAINGERRVRNRLSDVAEVSIRNPVRLSRYSGPEPDLVLLRRTRDVTVVPDPSDVLLLVEVAGATLRFDRDVKLPLYAAAGIPEVWIVNRPERRIECFRNPGASGYETTAVVDEEGHVEATLVPELGSISVAVLLEA